jgi:hypothetical protein
MTNDQIYFKKSTITTIRDGGSTLYAKGIKLTSSLYAHLHTTLQ